MGENDTANAVEAIRAKLGSVEDVLDAANVDRDQRGKFRCIAPGHEDHNPSASIDPDTGRWKCFSCGAGGDAIDAWAQLSGYGNDMRVAIRMLCEKFGINGDDDSKSTQTTRRPAPASELERLQRDMPHIAAAIRPEIEPIDGRTLNFEWSFATGAEGHEKRTALARPYDQVTDQLVTMHHNTLARVGNMVFAKPDEQGGEVTYMTNAADMFGHMGSINSTPIGWKTITGAMTKAEAFSQVRMRLHAFDAIETAPHEPSAPNRYYNHPALPAPDYASLDDLISTFCPESPHDRTLIRAFMLTLVWGGRDGQRPAWIIASPDGRGSGKTTLAEMGAYLVNQNPLSTSSKGDFEQFRTRLLSPEGLTTRIAILDNETGRVTSGDLAALITSRTISGRQLYTGEGVRPNNLVWVITLNTPSLDSDLASRGVPISILKPEYSPLWREETERLIEDHRWGIISALIHTLRRASPIEDAASRWGAWECDVLRRAVADADEYKAIQALILERQRAFDDEADEVDLIRDAIADAIQQGGVDVATQIAFLPNSYAAEIYNDATGSRYKKQTAIREIDNLIRLGALPDMEKCRHGQFGRGYEWSSETAPYDGAKLAVVRKPTLAGDLL